MSDLFQMLVDRILTGLNRAKDLKAQIETADNRPSIAQLVSKSREAMAKDSKIRTKAGEFFSYNAKEVWEFVEANPLAAAALYEFTSDLRSELKDYADAMAEEIARQNRPAAPEEVRAMNEEGAQIMKELRASLELLANIAGDELPKEIREVVEKNKAGNKLLFRNRGELKFRTESSTDDDDAPTENLRNTSVVYFVNGERIPAGTSLQKIAAFHMSSGTQRVTKRQLLEAQMGNKSAEFEWTAPNGNTIKAVKRENLED